MPTTTTVVSRAVALHNKKDKSMKTSGGVSGTKFTVSPSSGEVVSKAKMKQGKESTWAIDTRMCRKDLGLKGMVLFNVGKDGKALYTCVKDRQAKRTK